MYTYDFAFYKPGKKFYTQEEITSLKNSLTRADFEVTGKWRADGKDKEKIEFVNFHLRKAGKEFSLILIPAEEDFHGRLGQLAIPEEQFEEDPKESANLTIKAATEIFIDLKPLFGWGDHELQLNRLEQFLRFDKIGALAWVNFLSRELVERLGGLDKVIQFPDEKKSHEGKPWQFTYVLLSHLPTDPLTKQMALICRQRYPGAILRVG